APCREPRPVGRTPRARDPANARTLQAALAVAAGLHFAHAESGHLADLAPGQSQHIALAPDHDADRNEVARRALTATGCPRRSRMCWPRKPPPNVSPEPS